MRTNRFPYALLLATCSALVVPFAGCWPIPGVGDSAGDTAGPDDPDDPDDSVDDSLPKLVERRSDLPRDTAPSVSDEDKAQLRDGNLDLGFSLLRSGLAEDSENLAISATSIRTAFGMVHAMAAEDTQTAIAQGLGLPAEPAATQSSLNHLDLELMDRNMPGNSEAGPVVLSTANRMFVQTGREPGGDYLDKLATHYDAGVFLTDFAGDAEMSRQQINRWVSKRTYKKIPELFPKGSTERIDWVVVNAIYLKAPWTNQFGSPRPRDFTLLDGTTVQAQMMYQDELRTDYGTQPDFSWVRIPLRGHDLSFTVILPNEGQHDKVQSSLSASTYQTMLAEAKTGNVGVSLPKFKIETGTLDLTDIFRQKMPGAFKAGFPGFSPDDLLSPISFILHSVFVAADEKGVEAAAATAVGGKESAVELDFELSLDRPFFFTIHDEPTGVALFTGRVMDPTK